MTSLLSLPLVGSNVVTSTNEYWYDSWVFQVASSALAFQSSGNAGNGLFGPIVVTSGAPIGNSTVIILSVDLSGVAAFSLTDASGNALGYGSVGIPFAAAGFQFTVNQGSRPFAVDDSFTIVVYGAPIDLTGITFLLSIRKVPGMSSGVLVTASSDDGSGYLLSGDLNGVIGTAFPDTVIAQRCPAGKYGFDILAKDFSGIKRRVVDGTLTITDGYTYAAS